MNAARRFLNHPDTPILVVSLAATAGATSLGAGLAGHPVHDQMAAVAAGLAVVGFSWELVRTIRYRRRYRRADRRHEQARALRKEIDGD